jgi:prevent-host-death family protein
MKVATVREVQRQLAHILEWVANGEEVRITRRGTTIARIVPPEPARMASPNFVQRARKAWGAKPGGPPISELVERDRRSR